jgi:tripeptide aminopeptidase
MDNELIKTFYDLIRIPSPSGFELNTAKYIQSYLKKIGVDSYIDNSGKSCHSNSGNVIAKVGKGKPKLMFIAHMDTVEDGKKTIKPVIKNDIIWSDGTTILGSDDKAGVASVLEAVRELRNEKDLPSFFCVFSIMEECGCMGTDHLKLGKIKFVFDVDGSNAPGNFINKAFGDADFDLYIYGKEAHAAGSPEKGLNAIKTAGIIISKLKLGRDSKGHTTNVGTISGGKQHNVIPAHVVMSCETRAYRIADINENFKKIESVVKEACKITGCKYKLIRKRIAPPLYTKESEKIIELARRASLAAGLKFKLLTISATIQGGSLAAKGYTVLGLSKGGRLAHSNNERISIKELEQSKRLIMEIVKQSRNY